VNLTRLLSDLHTAGVSAIALDPPSGKVRWQAPTALPADLRDAVAASKPALLRLADGPLVASPTELVALARRLPTVNWAAVQHCCQQEQWQRAYEATGLARLNDADYADAVAYIEAAKATALAALTAAWPAPVAPVEPAHRATFIEKLEAAVQAKLQAAREVA
jgi:hypothetical protein